MYYQQLPVSDTHVDSTYWVKGTPMEIPYEPSIDVDPDCIEYVKPAMGALIHEIQSNASRNTVRTFAYNFLSRDHYQNQEFINALTFCVNYIESIVRHQYREKNTAISIACQEIARAISCEIALAFPSVLGNLTPNSRAEVHEWGTNQLELINQKVLAWKNIKFSSPQGVNPMNQQYQMNPHGMNPQSTNFRQPSYMPPQNFQQQPAYQNPELMRQQAAQGYYQQQPMMPPQMQPMGYPPQMPSQWTPQPSQGYYPQYGMPQQPQPMMGPYGPQMGPQMGYGYNPNASMGAGLFQQPHQPGSPMQSANQGRKGRNTPPIPGFQPTEPQPQQQPQQQQYQQQQPHRQPQSRQYQQQQFQQPQQPQFQQQPQPQPQQPRQFQQPQQQPQFQQPQQVEINQRTVNPPARPSVVTQRMSADGQYFDYTQQGSHIPPNFDAPRNPAPQPITEENLPTSLNLPNQQATTEEPDVFDVDKDPRRFDAFEKQTKAGALARFTHAGNDAPIPRFSEDIPYRTAYDPKKSIKYHVGFEDGTMREHLLKESEVKEDMDYLRLETHPDIRHRLPKQTNAKVVSSDDIFETCEKVAVPDTVEAMTEEERRDLTGTNKILVIPHIYSAFTDEQALLSAKLELSKDNSLYKALKDRPVQYAYCLFNAFINDEFMDKGEKRTVRQEINTLQSSPTLTALWKRMIFLHNETDFPKDVLSTINDLTTQAVNRAFLHGVNIKASVDSFLLDWGPLPGQKSMEELLLEVSGPSMGQSLFNLVDTDVNRCIMDGYRLTNPADYEEEFNSHGILSQYASQKDSLVVLTKFKTVTLAPWQASDISLKIEEGALVKKSHLPVLYEFIEAFKEQAEKFTDDHIELEIRTSEFEPLKLTTGLFSKDAIILHQ